MLDRVERDQRFRLEVPGNGISRSGVDLIRSYLYQKHCHNLPSDWRWEWLVPGKGDYVGSLPKRIAKWYKREHTITLAPDVLSHVGNLGTQHCDKNREYFFDFTQDFNWKPGSFGEATDSCYWGCRSGARVMLKDNNAWAVRFYQDETYSQGFARAWVVDNEDWLAMFNGYGLDICTISRIVAQFLDNAYYCKINLRNYGQKDATLWINGGVGWAVGPQDIVTAIGTHDFEWEDPIGKCCECGEQCGERWHEYQHLRICNDCFCDNYFECTLCERIGRQDDGYCSEHWDGYLCESCHTHSTNTCPACDEEYLTEDGAVGPDGQWYCSDCLREEFVTCQGCGGAMLRSESREGPDEQPYCAACYEEVFPKRRAESEATCHST
jgi:hypothetical protein